MAKTLAKALISGNEYRVVFDSRAVYNKYKVLRRHYVPCEGWHQKTIESYADYSSALYRIAEESRPRW